MVSHAQSTSAATRRQAFADHVVELMSGFGGVEAKRMFGGHGLFCHGLMFAIIVNEVLYFKADDASRSDFTSRGLKPFQYEAKDRARTSLNYYEAPPEVYDEAEHMVHWAKLAYECAVRQHDAKQKKARAKGAGKVAGKRSSAKAKAVVQAPAAGATLAHRASKLAELPNLGPKSVEMLAKAGVDTAAQLRKMGSVQAYVKVKAKSPKASLNLLWALEGALTGRDWKTVAEEDRASLLMALEDAQKGP